MWQWLTGRKSSRKSVSLEEQVASLAMAGIRLRPNITMDHLLASFDRQQYESDPYRLLLVRMGGETEDEAALRISDNIWHLDTECIEGDGDYVRVAERMRTLAGAALPIEELADRVNVEEREVWLEFTLEGKRIHWNLKVQEDWIDEAILGRFATLLTDRLAGRKFTYLDLEGQDCLIGCCTREQLQQLRTLTGLDFIWLT